MAEDHMQQDSIRELENYEALEEEKDFHLKEGDSDGLSGSSTDGDFENEQRKENDDDNKHPRPHSRRRQRQRRNKSGKHHNYRKYHRPYRPYPTLSLDEKQKVDEKIEKKASSRNEDQFAAGHPMAPFNTTQFLIDDHIKSKISPDLSNEPPSPVPVIPTIIDAEEKTEENEPSEASEDFLGLDGKFPEDSQTTSVLVEAPQARYDREFVATYENANQDRMFEMSKDDLIRLNVSLERRCATMERALKRVINANNRDERPNSDATDNSVSRDMAVDTDQADSVGAEC